METNYKWLNLRKSVLDKLHETPDLNVHGVLPIDDPLTEFCVQQDEKISVGPSTSRFYLRAERLFYAVL